MITRNIELHPLVINETTITNMEDAQKAGLMLTTALQKLRGMEAIVSTLKIDGVFSVLAAWTPESTADMNAITVLFMDKPADEAHAALAKLGLIAQMEVFGAAAGMLTQAVNDVFTLANRYAAASKN